MRCSKCKTIQETRKERLPRGWHRHEARIYCAACWDKLYRLRAVIFPVAEVLDTPWQEFTIALRDCWDRSTALANWAVTELAKADVTRSATDTKLAPMPQVNLYQLWQNHYQRHEWTGAAQSANALLRSVEQKYRKARLEVIWRSAAVLPRHRYAVPYPVHNAAWKARHQEYRGKDGQVSQVPVVEAPLAGRQWTLRLRGGTERRRQLVAFAQIVSGEAIQGELALYRKRSSTSCHRSHLQERVAGNGAKVSYRIMCKLVAWLPRPKVEQPQTGILQLRTARNALWVAQAPDREEPWILHANYVRRWIKVHRWKLDKISDDTKAEKRRPKRNRRQTNEHLQKLTNKQHRRLDSFCHRATKMLAAYAARCGVAEVVYNDRDRQYFSEFPWYQLRQLLEQKLEDEGILLTLASAEVVDDGEAAQE